MKITEQKRGVALIWAVVVSTILLLVTTTMVNSTIKESRISLRTDSSAVAYAAANSGIDIGRKLLDDPDSGITPSSNPITYTIDNNGEVTAQVVYSKDPKGNWILDSTGIVGDVSRKLQYKYISRSPSRIKFADIANAFPNNGSYNEIFQFWFASATRPNQFQLGYGDDPASPNSSVWMRYDEDYVDASTPNCSTRAVGSQQAVVLKYKKATYNGGNSLSSSPICLADYGLNLANFDGNNNRFVAEIKYVDQAAVQLTLKKWSTSGTDCIASVSLPLTDPAFEGFSKGLNKIYSNISPSPPSTTTQPIPQIPYRFEMTASNNAKVDFESLQLYN